MYKISNISAITLHITEVFHWEAYSGTNLPWPCSYITQAAFGVLRHNINTVFICRSRKNELFSLTSWARWLATARPFFLLKRNRQNNTAVEKLKYVSLTSSMRSSCCDYILSLLLLYFKPFSCKNATGRLDINGPYRVKKLSARRDSSIVFWRKKTSSSRMRYIVIMSLNNFT